MNIMIIGSFDGKNIGDNAILTSIISQIEKVHGTSCKIYIPSKNDYVKKVFNSKSHVIPINIRLRTISIRFFGLRTLLALFKVDLIVTTAGILFDYNSSKFLSSSFTVSLAPLLTIARLFNKKIVGLNVGIINNKTKGEWLLKYVLKQHDVLYLRDPNDKAVIENMNINIHTVDSADIAFTNEIVKKSFVPEKDSRKRIGVNLNQYLNKYASDSNNTLNYDTFIKLIAMNLDRIIKDLGYDVCFYPTAQMDLDIHNDVIKKMKYQKNCTVFFDISLEKTVRELNKVEMLVGMRMHSLIFATGLGKPVISLNYSPKVSGFMGLLKMEKFSCPITEMKSDTLFLSVENIRMDYGYYLRLQQTNRTHLENEALKSLESIK